MNIWVVLMIGGLITYLIRLSFIFLFGRISIPAWLQRALRFVPPAVLSAIIFSEVLLHSGSLDISFSNLRMMAAIGAILVAWRTRSTLFTIVAGMAILWSLQAIFH